MQTQTATLLFYAGIIGLLWLDRRADARISAALYIPFLWLWTNSSRSFTEWLIIIQTGHPPTVDKAASYADGSPLDRNILIILMVLAIIILARRPKFVGILKANALIVLFLVFAGMSVFWSDFPDITLRRWFKALGCLLFAMVVFSERDKDAALKRLLVWTGFILIPLSVLFIKYYPAIGRMNLIISISDWASSPVGVTSHKNSLGEICQFFGVVSVWNLLDTYFDRDRRRRYPQLIAHGALLAMVIWLFIQANSVTSQSCFMLATVLLLITSSRAVVRKRWLIHLVFFLLVALPFSTLFLGIGSGAIQDMGRDSTLTGRTDIWKLVIKLVPNPVLGTGFESFWLGNRLTVMDDYQKSLNESHNGFIEMYASLGWIGVILLAAIIVKGYRAIMASFRTDPATARLRLALFLIIIVSSFTEATFRTAGVFWTGFLLIMMADKKYSPIRRFKPESPKIPAQECVEAPINVLTGVHELCGGLA